MESKRFFAVMVALVALLTTALAPFSGSIQAAPPASPAAVIAWNGIARRASIQVAKQSTAHAMFSIAFTQRSWRSRAATGPTRCA